MYIHVYMCWIVYIIISSRTYKFTATVADLYNLNYIVVVLYTSVRTTLYLHTYIHARAITYLYERPNVEPNVTFRTRLITVTFRSGDIILLSCYIKHGQEEKLLKNYFHFVSQNTKLEPSKKCLSNAAAFGGFIIILIPYIGTIMFP